jgi:predicted ATPase/serine phosphatase RsbU (regulator of sigma subunit)
MMTLNLPGYEALETLHRGTKSAVFRARRQRDQLPVVIKATTPHDPSPSGALRLYREHEILNTIEIPGVVRSYGMEHHQDIHALILEDFGGISLKRVIDSTRLDLQTILQIASQLADTLAALHQRNIVHKDVNPSNIIFNGDTSQVKITDFSIASLLLRETPGASNPHALEGTLPYLSPEQTGRMNRSIDFRTDFYSLGVTLFELLIGWLPFQSSDPLELVHCHIAKMPIPPCELNHDVPQTVSDIVMKLLSKTAEDRYQSARGLKADIDRCLASLVKDGHIGPFVLGSEDVSDHFIIPQRLYGREREIGYLLESFERTCQGRSEMVLIAGYPGVGKTALVSEVHKPIARQRGFFFSGKFEQFKRNVPYASLAQAFQELIRHLLAGTPEEIEAWRARLLNALGPNAQVLVPILPELELLLPNQPSVQDLPPTESQNRFNSVFQSFVRAVAQRDHPLVLFIDDLQWADLASLKLIELLMSDPENKHLLILGAYRDQEVGADHPLSLTLQEIRGRGATVNEIFLRPLDQSTTGQFIADALHTKIQRNIPLAALVHQKTGGNPYFMNEFLKSLHEEQLLVFDAAEGEWEWDLGEIQQKGITDNVVTLMTGKIQRLPQNTERALRTAACLGSSFDLTTLSFVLGQTQARTASDLWDAIQEGLVLPIGDSYKFVREFGSESERALYQPPTHYTDVSYKFSHDRVRQAAYTIIPENQRPAIHLHIGRCLLEKEPEHDRDEHLFDIVNHLNLGTPSIVDKVQKLKLAEWNLIAGRKAKESAAFDAALKYFTSGRLLLENDWATHYQLCYDLHRECGECEYLTGNFEASEHLFDLTVARSGTHLDKAHICAAKAMLYTAMGKYDRAMEAGLAGLRLLGVRISPNPSKLSVAIEILRTKWNLRGKPIESLALLPAMGKPGPMIAVDILANLMTVAYSSSAELSAIAMTTMLNLTLRHGSAPVSSYSFTNYGLLVGSGLGSYDKGLEFGKLGIAVADHFRSKLFLGRCNFIVGAVLNHWRNHASGNLTYLNEGQRFSTESGDLQFVAIAHIHIVLVSLFTGASLDELFARATEYVKFGNRVKFEDFTHESVIARQIVLCLKGETASAGSYSGVDFQEEEYLKKLESTKFVVAKMYYIAAKMQTSFLFGDFATVESLAAGSTSQIHALMGQLPEVEYNFYHSLGCAALLPDAPPEKAGILSRSLHRNQKKMKKWADNCAANFLHKYQLIEAERARLHGNKAQAMDLYDKAIASAREHGFVQNEALASELAGRFYWMEGKEKIANTYLLEARRAYLAWGATGKARQLEHQYPGLIADEAEKAKRRSVTETTTIAGDVAGSSLDLISVLKASQALSGEIVLGKLLERMIEIVVENAGAERGCLLMEKENALVIVAEREERTRTTETLQWLPAAEGGRVCAAIVQYVARTRDHVVLTDATISRRFASDPYVVLNKPRSILCAPILHQGKLSALLYLENNLTAGAFNRERIEVLRLLSSQIAISIENALLHEQEKAFARMQEEVRLAAQIQQNLLPQSSPAVEGYEIAGSNVPAHAVGGDYFDFIQISEDRWAICIGDVSGKGLPASLLMANLQATLRGQTLLDSPPSECLRRANRLLYQSTSPEKFATLFYGILDTRRHTLLYSNAGHDNPFVLRLAVETRRLKTGGIPLGMFEDFVFDEETISVEPGDLIVMCSDGIAEAMNANEEQFGEQRLSAILVQSDHPSPHDVIRKILETAKEFTGSTPQSDDMTVVVLRRT